MEFIDAKLAAALVAGADRLERKEIEDLARQRLHFLVDYAREHSPYLKEKHEDLPENYRLADIPISTREELTQQFDRWVCDPEITTEKVDEYVADFENLFTPFLGKYRVISTSGTTARPLRIVRDSRHIAIHDALMAERYYGGLLLKDVEGLKEPDLKQCAIIAPGGLNSSYLSFERVRRSYKARGIEDRTLFLSTLAPVDEMIRKLNEFQPDVIGCYPSVIYTLAFEQKAGRLNIHPKIIGCSAEKLTEENRKFISEAFGCPVNDNYCSTEGGEVAMLCPNGHMHVNSDWVIVEPVDRENNPVPCGVKSEGILMTNLACLVQPVIRYRMTDSVIMHDEICGCGLNTPWIEIDGRVDDILEFDHNGTTVRMPAVLFELCTKDIPGCDHCQVIQRAHDAIEMRISVMQGYDRVETEQKILFSIQQLFESNGLNSIRIELVNKPLERTRSGKLRIAFKEFFDPDKYEVVRDMICKTVSEAYIYAFPLVIMDATKTSSTNAVEFDPIKGKAPVNQLMHGEKLADASFKAIVSPNVDTVYSSAWYDLSDEPMVYVFPETDRFCNVQVFDAWTNTVSVFDKAGDYAIALSTWEGDLPEGVTRINVPTAMSWSIARTVLSGEEDLPNVRAIQQKMKILPLSAYVQGGEYSAPKGSYAQENDYVPIQKVLSLGPQAFFDKANELMKTNPPAPADAEKVEKLAEINVGPGMNFDLSILSGDIDAKWKEMLQNLRAEFETEVTKFSVDLGQWSYFGPPIGDFGTEYTYRAAVALRGLGANTVDVALYMRTDVDDSGEMLTADKTYTMHFEAFPPILDGGFWSVTAYGSDDFLIDNPIDRYCINDRTKFVLNDDGSLDIILSEGQPKDIANWLPVSGDFHLMLRIYTPDIDALATWQAPVIRVSD